MDPSALTNYYNETSALQLYSMDETSSFVYSNEQVLDWQRDVSYVSG